MLNEIRSKYLKKKSVKSVEMVFLALMCLLIAGCSGEEADGPLFRLLDNKEIGIEFSNYLTYDKDFNVYKYRNFYNGGGVADGYIYGIQSQSK
jgi:hypothetical protein